VQILKNVAFKEIEEKMPKVEKHEGWGGNPENGTRLWYRRRATINSWLNYVNTQGKGQK